MSDFAPSVDHCRQAFESITARLPAGFITGGFFPLWLDAIRSGHAGTRRTDLALLALLPDADRWPVLEPICSLMSSDETPQSLFLRTVTAKTSAVGRDARSASVAASFPIRRFSAVQDSRTCPEHLALDGTTKLATDPFWKTVDGSPRWGCRCHSTYLNARTAKRRGYRVS